jgi:hypothetical protein
MKKFIMRMTAVDQREPHDVKFDSIEDFESGWGPIREIMLHDRHVTNDGINTMWCEDKHSVNLIKEYLEEKQLRSEFKEKFYYLSTSYDALQLTEEQAFALFSEFKKGGNDPKPVKGKFGNIFIIDSLTNEDHKEILNKFLPNQELLKKLTMPSGSFRLKDTLIIQDGASLVDYIIDTRGEAESILDLLPRSVEKSSIVWIDHSDENNSQTHAFSGADDVLNKMLVTLNYAEISPNNGNPPLEGFSNSETNPMPYFMLRNTAEHGKKEFFTNPNIDLKYGVKELSKVTKEACMASGAKGSEIYVENEQGKVIVLTEGQYIDREANMKIYSSRELAALGYKFEADREHNIDFPF